MSKIELFEKERASGYNQFIETWMPNYTYFLQQLPQLLQPVQDKTVLVVGCGTGNEVEQFVQSEEQWRITGVDPSPEMLEQAIDRFQSYEGVNFIKGDLSKLEAGMQYNAATLLLVLHFMADDGSKLALLKDVAQHLAVGASLVLLDITGSKKQLQENLQILKRLLPRHIDQEQVDKRLKRIEEELFFVSEERLTALLVEAGFEPPCRFFQSTIYMGWLTQKKK